MPMDHNPLALSGGTGTRFFSEKSKSCSKCSRLSFVQVLLILAVTQFALDDSLAFNRFAAGPSYTLQFHDATPESSTLRRLSALGRQHESPKKVASCICF